jgi:deoxycytidine triphosphate deaminase
MNMSIKSDKWIRRMAESTGMIEPFEPGQVRFVNDQRIVSYGTSSYGYDIRCANEFKIFTNVNSSIIDPKNLPAVFRRAHWRHLHHPAELICTRAHGRVLPHTALCTHRVLGQIYLRTLRHHCERHAV